MRFDASQHMRMSQQMKLAPHMIQSMEILQMPLAALEERIEQELENNATLELVEPGEEAPADRNKAADDEAIQRAEDGPLRVDEGSAADDFERLDTFEATEELAAENAYESVSGDDRRPDRSLDDLPRSRSMDDGGSDAKSEAMANTADRAEPPAEQLRKQWGLVEVDERVRALGDLIIAYIEDDGYLRTPLETIADRAAPDASGAKPTAAELARALQAVQLLLEPPGVAARDTKECLLLQIEAKREEDPVGAADWQMARTIVEGHLDDLANNRLPKVAQKLGVTMDALKRGIERLRGLSLSPGRQLLQEAEPGIVPDAFVEYDPENDRYYAYLNDRRLPNLRVNQEYAKLAKDKHAPKPTREFIKTNLGNAQFLIDAIEQRNRTVLRVVEAVVEAQREYFDFGPQALRPLPMTRVADQMGVHVATVSRAVAGKWLATPRGMVELRKFFTGGTENAEGEAVSWDAIKAALQDVIQSEDKKNPLSDDQLAAELKKRGLEIARRTVAKYRDQLGIRSGRLRKAH
jgi:RNA polymerase sigma-54 factor